MNACPLCDAIEDRARLPTPGSWVDAARFERCRPALALARCRRCDLVFVDPRPDDATLRAFYDQQDYTGDAAAATRAAAHQLDVLADLGGVSVTTGTRLLDLGCGGGHLLAEARGRGADVLGFDLGAPSRAACAARGLAVTDRADEVARRRFDVVVISHTLEHVPDLAGTLARCRDALDAGGRLLVEVPNARSLRARLSPPLASRRLGFDERYRAFPVHLSYFTPATLRAALGRSGLDVVAMTTSGLGVDALGRARRRG